MKSQFFHANFTKTFVAQKSAGGNPICLPDDTCLISTLSLRSFCLFMKIDRINPKKTPKKKNKPVQLKV